MNHEKLFLYIMNLAYLLFNRRLLSDCDPNLVLYVNSLDSVQDKLKKKKKDKVRGTLIHYEHHFLIIWLKILDYIYKIINYLIRCMLAATSSI